MQVIMELMSFEFQYLPGIILGILSIRFPDSSPIVHLVQTIGFKSFILHEKRMCGIFDET